MDYSPNPELLSIMLEAYEPCQNFGKCRQAQWNPSSGQVPRGFLGATGRLNEVDVIMVFAEPGHPHTDEVYDTNSTPIEILESGLRHVYHCYKSTTDLFHRNVRWFMSEIYPDLSFDDQLRRIWLTEGRLCSIDVEIGSTKDRTCAFQYLNRQLNLFPNATIVAFGGKAKYYLRGLNVDALEVYALAPPGANHRPAKPSWERAIETIKSRQI